MRVAVCDYISNLTHVLEPEQRMEHLRFEVSLQKY